jgi:hypothetical protein
MNSDDTQPGPEAVSDSEGRDDGARLDSVRRRFLTNAAKAGVLAPVVLTVGSRSAFAVSGNGCSLAGNAGNCTGTVPKTQQPQTGGVNPKP